MNFPSTPDKQWLEVLKIGFGFLLLVILASLAALIAIGHVQMETSYGLPELIGGLLTLSGGFCSWAFRLPNAQLEGNSHEPTKDSNGL